MLAVATNPRQSARLASSAAELSGSVQAIGTLSPIVSVNARHRNR
jgi:hypothetical protein